MFTVEMLLAWEDGTWTTREVECDLSLQEATDYNIERWWYKTYGGHDIFRKVVVAKVFDINPDEIGSRHPNKD